MVPIIIRYNFPSSNPKTTLRISLNKPKSKNTNARLISWCISYMFNKRGNKYCGRRSLW